MKIIIEGIDGSGKTTLAKKLAEVFKATIQHDSNPCDIDTYIARLSEPGDVIFDRFMLGQFVYNTPEERKMTHMELVELIDYCQDRKDVMLIYLDTSVEVALQRLKNRGDKETKMLERLGVTTIEEYLTETKRRYNGIASVGFAVVNGDNL